jgi:hypothetical protein
MRRELIEALSYPKLLVQKQIEERNCPHDCRFDATDERCHHCDLGHECHWVTCLNEFDDFDGKANHTINASLRYGIKLVERLHSELRHDEATCTCEACIWIRESQRLTEAFDARFVVKPYRQMD